MGLLEKSSEYHTAAEPFLKEGSEDRNRYKYYPYRCIHDLFHGLFKPFWCLRHKDVQTVSQECHGHCGNRNDDCHAEASEGTEMTAVKGISCLEEFVPAAFGRYV